MRNRFDMTCIWAIAVSLWLLFLELPVEEVELYAWHQHFYALTLLMEKLEKPE